MVLSAPRTQLASASSTTALHQFPFLLNHQEEMIQLEGVTALKFMGFSGSSACLRNQATSICNFSLLQASQEGSSHSGLPFPRLLTMPWATFSSRSSGVRACVLCSILCAPPPMLPICSPLSCLPLRRTLSFRHQEKEMCLVLHEHTCPGSIV